MKKFYILLFGLVLLISCKKYEKISFHNEQNRTPEIYKLNCSIPYKAYVGEEFTISMSINDEDSLKASVWLFVDGSFYTADSVPPYKFDFFFPDQPKMEFSFYAIDTKGLASRVYWYIIYRRES